MTEDQRNGLTTTSVNDKANLIWGIANIIGQGLYKPHEFGKIILPMTVIKRFNDTLMTTKQEVLDTYEKIKHLEVKDGFLRKASGRQFYNTSPFTFDNLLDDSEHIEANFRTFLAGFSENVQDVLENFEFDKEITKLADNNMLFAVIQEFNKKNAYMGAGTVSSTEMGYIFEELVRRFSESYNEQAGAHFTSRDIIYLMTDLLIAEDEEILQKDGAVQSVYDQTMGTSQMLTAMEERLADLNKDVRVVSYGQELNPETYAIAKADAIIKGADSENMQLGNTLTNDKFPDRKFDYIISNPPFGIDWRVEKDFVEAEHKQGDKGRFGVGLPSIGDGQQLFTLNGISKLKEDGKMAIIHNGSALFNGNAGSGSSEIRRHIIENDWLEAIVQLPADSFYNTGITTYVWFIAKNKPAHRQGKVQLIDASEMYEKRRKAIGNKRNDITEVMRNEIVKAYVDFENKEYKVNGKVLESKVFDNEDFGYHLITVETPLKLRIDITKEKMKELEEERQFKNLARLTKAQQRGKTQEEIEEEIKAGEETQEEVLKVLAGMTDDTWMSRDDFLASFEECLSESGKTITQPFRNTLASVFGTQDNEAEVCLKKNGDIEPNVELRDTEEVPLKEDIATYFEREVIPYNPEAWIDDSKTKLGFEIPFTRHFYKYEAPEKADVIADRIMTIEGELMRQLEELFEADDYTTKKETLIGIYNYINEEYGKQVKKRNLSDWGIVARKIIDDINNFTNNNNDIHLNAAAKEIFNLQSEYMSSLNGDYDLDEINRIKKEIMFHLGSAETKNRKDLIVGGELNE